MHCAWAQVFGAVSELVQSALDGYHVCLFSYGQTGAGKTHTMQGSDAMENRGIIPRAVEKVGRGQCAPCAKNQSQSEVGGVLRKSIAVARGQVGPVCATCTSECPHSAQLHALCLLRQATQRTGALSTGLAGCAQILDTADKLREQEWEYNMEASFIEVGPAGCPARGPAHLGVLSGAPQGL